MTESIAQRALRSILLEASIFTTRGELEEALRKHAYIYQLEESKLEGVTEEALAIVNAGTLATVNRAELEKAGVLGRYLWCRMDNFEGLEKLCGLLGCDLRQWPFERSPEGWSFSERSTLVAFGPTGTGKTHLATGILARCLEAGVRCRWFDVADWLTTLKGTIGASREGGRSQYHPWLDAARSTPVIVLDELVLEDLTTPFTSGTVAEILRIRYAKQLPTIVTTNNDVETIHEFDVRLGSRALGNDAILVPLGGRDRRQPVKTTADIKARLKGGS